MTVGYLHYEERRSRWAVPASSGRVKRAARLLEAGTWRFCSPIASCTAVLERFGEGKDRARSLLAVAGILNAAFMRSPARCGWWDHTEHGQVTAGAHRADLRDALDHSVIRPTLHCRTMYGRPG
jgi:hypothetical protein